MTEDDSITLLLVDDDPEVIRLLCDRLTLADQSFDFITQTEPEAALETVETHPELDCIISDYRMPVMNGIELLQRIRASNPEIPFILLTAEGSEEVASKAINAGSTGYLRKRATREQIDATVDLVVKAVRKYNQRQQLRERLTLIDHFFGSIDDIVYVTNSDRQLVYWNDALSRVTGYADTEIYSLDLLRLFSERDHEKLSELVTLPSEESVSRVEVTLLTKHSNEIPFEFSRAPFQDATGEILGICGVGRDITEQKQYERALRGLHETTCELLQVSSREEIATVLTSATAQVVDNPVSTVQLIEGDRLVPVSVPEEMKAVLSDPPVYDVDEDTPVSRVYRSGTPEYYTNVEEIDDGRDRGALKQVYYYPLGDYGTLNLGLTTDDPISESSQRLTEVLAANGTAALSRIEQESELCEREQMLGTLHGTARELIRATTPEAIAEIVIEAASNILTLPAVTVYLWDGETGVLRPAAATGDTYELFGELPVFAGGDSIVWDVFVEGDTRLVRDVSQDDSVYNPETVIQSELFVPIGNYGVLLSGAVESGVFGESDVEFAELLASGAKVALERTEHKHAIRRQENQLKQQNEHLQRLNRVNKIIRDINKALVRAESHAEIERAVCEELTNAEHYLFAWLGNYDSETGITAHAWAGEGQTFLNSILGERDIEFPPTQTLESEKPVVIQNIFRDEPSKPWRKKALDRGFRSVACFPLIDRNHHYGFFEVYGDQPNVFTDEEVAVLEELAAHIANAISAVQRKEALLSGHSVSLEFEVDPLDDALFNLAETGSCSFDVEALTPHQDDSWLVYATFQSEDPAPVLAAAEESVSIKNADMIRTSGSGFLLALIATDLTLASTLIEEGGSIQSLHVDANKGRVTVTLSSATNVRSFVDNSTEVLPQLDLLRRKVISKPTSDSLKYDLSTILTEKQLQALQTAYLEGYFEWPRNKTGEEVAESLGVSGPTFQQHIRKGIHRMLRDTFDSD